MRRRQFITLLGGAAAAWPLAARAQGERVRRVGVLMGHPEADPEGQARFQTFRQRLADLGWVEGRNLRLDVRWAGPDAAPQRNHARDLVTLAPDVILTHITNATQALRDATRTIPIVFVNLSDPVATRIVSNLARPEANVTGFMSFEHSLAGKWLSLLKDMAPRLTRVALLFNPDTVAPYIESYVGVAQEAGERLSFKTVLIAAGCAEVFAEKISGAITDRPELAKVLKQLKAGDVLCVTRLDRLARSTRDLLNILDTISKRGAGFKSLADAWADTTSAHGRLMVTMLAGIAEFERELIKSRTGEGRKRAQAAGVKFGRPPKLSAEQRHEARARLGAGETRAAIARAFGVHPTLVGRLA